MRGGASAPRPIHACADPPQVRRAHPKGREGLDDSRCGLQAYPWHARSLPPAGGDPPTAREQPSFRPSQTDGGRYARNGASVARRWQPHGGRSVVELGLSPTQSKPRFEAMLDQARRAEASGFATLWAHEHHSQAMMYPDPLLTLAALAGVTQRIGLGTNMLLLPIHHPVRVAQQGAMVDVLSNGRLVLGVANGYSATDFETFGIPRAERGARLTEGLELVRALWSGERVTREGRGFRLRDFALFPVPLQRPAPPIFVGGQAETAIRRAAKLGDGYLISTTETFDSVAERARAYRGARQELGLAPGKLLLNRVVCAVDGAAARRDAEAFFTAALLRLYRSWGHENVTQLPAARRDPATVSREHFVIGEPAACLERLRAYAELGIDHVACLMNFGDPDLALASRSLRLFEERVLPHLV
jgi:probable F420-dependent oxidoreductase